MGKEFFYRMRCLVHCRNAYAFIVEMLWAVACRDCLGRLGET
jgi:hypothetical protein